MITWPQDLVPHYLQEKVHCLLLEEPHSGNTNGVKLFLHELSFVFRLHYKMAKYHTLVWLESGEIPT